MTTAMPARKRLRPPDVARVASTGLRTRRLRAALSALGIAIGVAAIVAVLGLSASSQAGLLAEIDKLGTNLLTVTNGQTVFGQTAELPAAAPGMIRRIGPVTQVADTGAIDSAHAYRSPLIPAINTSALSVQAASAGLLRAVGTSLAHGRYLNAATATQPVAVLGAAAAERLGIDRVWPGERIWLGGQWFYVTGILRPAVLAPEIDTSVLVGFPAAHKSALNGLFLGLGAVALLVGGVGVANIMVISVLERRSEIGLRRALGATRGQIRTQFLSEAIMLAVLGGAAGVAAGAAATAIYATTRHWAIVIPAAAWAGGIGAALVIGAVAGLLPALRAARMSPTEALRTV